MNFLECVKITSIGLKLNRPQLQHLLFLERNKSQKTQLLLGFRTKPGVLCGLPVAYLLF